MNEKILIWLPTYNEEMNIDYMADGLLQHGYDFVICDGFSTDRTVEFAQHRAIKVVNRDGFGKGFAVQKGLQYSVDHGYDGLMLIDCDRTYDVEDIDKLIAHFEDHDMVVGTRSITEMEIPRKWANVVMTFSLNFLFRASSKDMASGLRLLRVNKFHGKIHAHNFDVEPEMYSLALGEAMRIKEIDISYNKRHGRSKVNILHLFLIIYRMVRERIRHL